MPRVFSSRLTRIGHAELEEADLTTGSVDVDPSAGLDSLFWSALKPGPANVFFNLSIHSDSFEFLPDSNRPYDYFPGPTLRSQISDLGSEGISLEDRLGDRFEFDGSSERGGRDDTASRPVASDTRSPINREETDPLSGRVDESLTLPVATVEAPTIAPQVVPKSDGGLALTEIEFTRMFVPTDSLFDSQWHLQNTGQLGGTPGLDINVAEIWDDYTGAGVRVGVIDDGVEFTHTDLNDNYNSAGQFDYGGNDSNPFPGTSDFHGTAVAGLIAAEQNGTGVVGGAFEASITGFRIFGGTVTESEFADVFNRQVDLDVANNSWGYNGYFFDDLDDSLFDSVGLAIENAVTNGRDGLGTVLLWAAGNDRLDGQDVNYHGFQNARESIAVAAVENTGDISFYSTPGAAILIAAPSNGGTAGITTTDRTGSNGYASGDFTFSFGGTSAATPITASVVALMLEANPLLGYRDVQEILAYSARQVDPSDSSWDYNGAFNWNGGGLHTSHDFGFGLVDAHAAVRLAETWTDQSTRANEASFSAFSAPNRTIVDNQTISDSLSIGSNANIDIEHVEVDLNLSHSWIGDLRVTLTSPDGTESVLVNRPGVSGSSTFGTDQDNINFTLSSTNHWGEDGVGLWTLEVRDSVTGDAGVLNDWTLSLYGETQNVDDTYIYTDELSTVSGAVSRLSLTDDNGGIDAINAAAITTDSIINLATEAAGIPITTDSTSSSFSASFAVTTTQYDLQFVGFAEPPDKSTSSAPGDAELILADRLGAAFDGVVTRGAVARSDNELADLDGQDVVTAPLIVQKTSSVEITAPSFATTDFDFVPGESTLDGRTVTIDANTIIEKAFAGDGNDILVGNDADNLLSGGRGDDILLGGVGNDTLDGGAGNDLFMIGAAEGHDIIDGFVAGAASNDAIDLSGLTDISSFSSLLSFATDDGVNTTFNFSVDQSVRLAGVRVNDLNASDFVLADLSPGSFEISDAVANESAGVLQFSVSRVGGGDGAVSVGYQTSNGSAVSPDDFAFGVGTITFADGDTSPKTITIQLVDDQIVEGIESFSVALSNPTGGATINDGIATGQIQDNDVATPTPSPPDQYPDAFADLDGVNGFRILNDTNNSFFGQSVSSAGDLNGDGFDDVIVGRHVDGSGGFLSGSAFVVFGGSGDATVNVADIEAGSGGFKITGESADDLAGFSIALAGDVNGDGFDDLLVGAPHNTAIGIAYNGDAYVIFGGNNVDDTDLRDIAAGTGGFKISGEARFDNFGYAVDGIGDFNGDGIDDFTVSARRNDENGSDAGAVYVVFGETGLGSVDIQQVVAGTGGIKIAGQSDVGFGLSVSGSGDVNGDGFEDLVISAAGDDTGGSDAGAAYVIFGHSGSSTVALSEISAGIGGFKIVGADPSDFAGRSVASAGDVNSDGFGDLIIGADGDDAGGDRAGAAYVVFGNSGLNSVDLENIAAGSGGFKIIGEAAGDFAGNSVSSAGDVDGDGFDDVIVGAQGNDAGGDFSGRAYVVFGGEGLGTTNLDNISNGIGGFKIVGENPGDRAGSSTAWAGDVNGDGIDDIIVGAETAGPGNATTGAAYVIFGGPPTPENEEPPTDGVNTAPIAVSDAIAVLKDTPGAIFPFELLANDTDADGDSLSIFSVQNAVNGTALRSGIGGVVFTPDAGFQGLASFEYTVSDGRGGSSNASVTVSVNPTNSSPIAGNDFVTALEDTPLTIRASDLLANDSDADGNGLKVHSVHGAQNGTISFNTDEDIVFTPEPGFVGEASFVYTVFDGRDTNGPTGSANATVTITVEPQDNTPPVNTAPVAIDDTSNSFFNGTNAVASIPIEYLLRNDHDPDGDPITLVSVQNAVHGSAVNIGGHDVFFTADTGFFGTAFFDYTISDGNGGTATATVAVSVDEPLNQAPIANPDAIVAQENAPLTILASEILSNDTDANGDVLTVTSVQSPVNGSVALNSGGNVVFTPTANFHGTASFQYTVSDGNGGTSAANVTVTVEEAPQSTNEALILGTVGDDQLFGTALNETIVGDDGNDTLSGEGGNDTLYGGQRDPNDQSAGADTLNGGAGNDKLFGAGGADRLFGEAGYDLLQGGNEADSLEGGTEDDYLLGGEGNDALDGGAGSDWLQGGRGNDSIVFGNGGDVDIVDLTGNEAGAQDSLTFTDLDLGNLFAYQTGDHFALLNVATDETVVILDYDPSTSADISSFTFGSDTVTQSSDLNLDGILDFEQFARPILGTSASETLQASTYTNRIWGAGGNDTLIGFDSLTVLYGGDGQDRLIDGGFLNANYLIGGSESDTYRVNNGGFAFIHDNAPSSQDKLELPSFNLNNALGVRVNNEHLLLLEETTNALVVVWDWLDTKGRIEEYVLSDITLTHNDFVSIASSLPNITWEDIGFSTSEVEGTFDDILALEGAAAGPLAPITVGGTNASETLVGYFGDNVMIGGLGNDTLTGLGGQDVYVYRSGDGVDTIDHRKSANPSENDTLRLGPDIDIENLSATRNGDELHLALGGSDGVNLTKWFAPDQHAEHAPTHFDIEFGDGGLFELRTEGDGIGEETSELIVATSIGSTLEGAGGNDVLVAFDTPATGAGNVLVGGDGSDILFGKAGADELTGGRGDDKLEGGTGNDLLIGGSGADSLNGGDDNDQLMGGLGADSLNGGDGADVIFGGIGGDIMSGGLGNDQFVIEAAPRQTGLFIEGGQDNVSGGVDHLYTQEDFDAATLFIPALHDFNFDGDVDTVSIQFHQDNSVIYSKFYHLRFSTKALDTPFAEGEYLDVMRTPFEEPGHPGMSIGVNGSGCNTLGGSFTVDEFSIDSSSGSPELSSFSVSFEQFCELGPVGMNGHFFYNVVAPEHDILKDFVAGAGSDDVLDLRGFESITTLDAVLAQASDNGSDVTLALGSDNFVTLEGVRLADLHADDFMFSSGFDQTLSGTDGADTLVGDVGDDLLLGGLGSDELRGGAGADTLFAGDFENLVRNSESFGTGTAWRSASVDISAGAVGPMGEGTATQMSGTSTGNGRIWQWVEGLQGGETYTLSFWHRGDNVRLAAAVKSFGSNLDTVYVGDSATWQHISLTVTLDEADSGFHFQIGGGGQLNLGKSAEIWGLQINTGDTAGGYVATGSTPIVALADTGQNTLFGDQDGDTLHGAAGADTLHGGDGNDHLFGYQGADVLNGDAGDDILAGGTGNDTLDGGSENDTLYGGAGDDLLAGGAGSDLIRGGAGADTLFSGAGDDTLDGGEGNDLFVVVTGDGADVIEGFSAGDRIDLLGQSAISNFADVIAAATDDGANTVLSFGGGDSLRLNGVRLADLTTDNFIVPTLDVTFTGGTGDDLFAGGIGNDTLDGAGGNDTLFGAAGADTVLGGDGADSLYGGVLMNLVRDSESYGAGTAWSSWAASMTAGDPAPVGSGTATRLSGTSDGNGRIWQLIDGLESGETYTLSFWHQGDNMRLAAAAVTFATNLDTVYVGDSAEWQHVSLTVTLGTEDTGFYFQVGGGGQLNLGKSAQIWGLQINTGDSVTDYVTTTDEPLGREVDTAANLLMGGEGADNVVGAAGDDMLLGGGGSDLLRGDKGADTLYGGDLENLVRDSENFVDGTAWKGAAVSFSAGGLGPEGTGTSTVLSGTSLNGRIWQLIDGLQGGETYTLSFWHRGDNVRLAAAAVTFATNFDTVYVGDSAEWQQVSLTVTLGNEDTGFYFQLGGGGQLNLGKSAEIWGAQINTGAGAGAYVATTDTPIIGSIDTAQNTLYGNEDDDALHGAAGSDTSYGGDGADRLSGYAGADLLYGEAGADLLDGGAGGDVLDGGAEADTLQGGDGDDLLLGGAGTDVLFGGAGNDSLDGGSEDDLLNGGDGDDVLNGGAGIDVLNGDAGADTLNGGAGADTLSGGAGNDIFALADGGGFDIINDFTAGDRIDLLGQSALSNFNDVLAVATDDGTNTIIPFGAGDGLQISGVRLADLTPDDFIMALPFVPDVTLLGGAGDDSLDGGVGADLLDGAGGNDTLFGATGADTLLGGDGADSLYGGTLMNLVRDSESYGPGSAWGSWAATLEAGDAAPDGSAGFATRLTGTDLGNGRIWQRIDGLEADETYTLSFWHQGDTMRAGAAALDWGSNLDTAFTGTSAEWQQVSLTVTLGAQETGFYFQVGGGGQLGLGKSAQLWGMQLNSGTSAADYAKTTDDAVGMDVDFDANILNGGDGDDRLVGAVGNDTLNGGSGDDVLIGGEGSDLFVFDLQNGADRIEDFSASEGDLIDATAHGLTDFAAVQGVLSNDGNGDAAIDFGSGNTITLIGVDQNQLTQDDFFFG